MGVRGQMLPRSTIPHRLARNASQMRKRPVAPLNMVSLSSSDGFAIARRPSSMLSAQKSGIDNFGAMEKVSLSRSDSMVMTCRPSSMLSSKKPSERSLSRKGRGQNRALMKGNHGDSLDWSEQKRNAILARQTDWINAHCGRENDVHQSLASGSYRSLKLKLPKKSNSMVFSNSLPVLHNVHSLAARSEERQVWDLSLVLNLPWETMKTAYGLFKKYVDNPGTDVSLVQQGRLSKNQFAKFLCALIDCNEVDELPNGIVEDAFKLADKDSGGELDFSEFAIWFSTYSFSEKLNLDARQRALRKLAKKYAIPHTQVDDYNDFFNQLDADDSGMIEPAEFPNLLCKCAKIPQNGLTATRVQQLWRDADTDGSGEVDFEEFLVFYRKYFDVKAGEGAGYENFYRSIRNHPWTQ